MRKKFVYLNSWLLVSFKTNACLTLIILDYMKILVVGIIPLNWRELCISIISIYTYLFLAHMVNMQVKIMVQ